jgi:hypothetical protein
MPTVETTIRVSIPEEGATLGQLEAVVARAVEEAGQRLLLGACGELEEEALIRLRRMRGRVQQVKMRPLDMLTRFGWVRLQRRQVVQREDGRYFCPLDDVLGLGPRQHASPWVQGQTVALATRIPYRQATALLAEWLGTPLDHRTVYAWVQQAGQVVVDDEDARQQAVFEDGEQPVSDPGVREIVVTEVDGTFVKAQREGSPNFEVRLGVLFSGKELESATAKHRRYRLKERVLYGGVEPAEAFGERLFLAGEGKLGLSHAGHLLLVGDGAEWIEALAGHRRWQATYQLDWWHLAHALHRTFPDRPALVTELKQSLYDGEGERLINLVSLARIAGDGDPERVAQLESYLRANRDGFYGARRLRQRLSPEAKAVAVEGSGAIEKQMDLAVGRRFKGQGMRWTRKGANRLLKLRLTELEKAA